MSKIIIESTWTVDNKNFADPLIITKSYLVSEYDGKKIPNSVVYSVDKFDGDNLNRFKTLKVARQYAKNYCVKNYKSTEFGNSAKIEYGKGRAYPGAPIETEYSLACYADYDDGKMYHFSVHETFKEAYNKMMLLNCGDWKEV